MFNLWVSRLTTVNQRLGIHGVCHSNNEFMSSCLQGRSFHDELNRTFFMRVLGLVQWFLWFRLYPAQTGGGYCTQILIGDLMELFWVATAKTNSVFATQGSLVSIVVRTLAAMVHACGQAVQEAAIIIKTAISRAHVRMESVCVLRTTLVPTLSECGIASANAETLRLDAVGLGGECVDGVCKCADGFGCKRCNVQLDGQGS